MSGSEDSTSFCTCISFCFLLWIRLRVLAWKCAWEQWYPAKCIKPHAPYITGKIRITWSVHRFLTFSFLFFFFFFGHPTAYGVSRTAELQLRPTLQLKQHWSLLTRCAGLGIKPLSWCCSDAANPVAPYLFLVPNPWVRCNSTDTKLA